MESKFADADLAERVYRSVVKRVLNSGVCTMLFERCSRSNMWTSDYHCMLLRDFTRRSKPDPCQRGTCCWYVSFRNVSTIDEPVTGQRAFIGKCNMNRNSPDSYREPSAEDSVEATKVLIKYIHSLSSPLVHPIITPRFAISCTDELLKSLGHLAASHPTMAIQTHISENKAEVAFTKELFPDRTSYADVYDHFGLLRDTTVLAHAVHLEDDEKKLIKQRNAGISHCPDSNFNLSSGVAPVGEFLDLGIKVGLGTDVSGGTSVSILRAVQMASVAAKTKAMQQPTPVTSGFANRALSIATLLYLATLGGAEVCCLDKVIGSFEQGKQFDALVVDIRDRFGGNPGLWGENLLDGLTEKQQLETSLERFLFCGDDRNIRRVFVKGKCVAGFAKD